MAMLNNQMVIHPILYTQKSNAQTGPIPILGAQFLQDFWQLVHMCCLLIRWRSLEALIGTKKRKENHEKQTEFMLIVLQA